MPHKIKLIFNPIANLGRAWPIAASLRPVVLESGGADWAGTVYPSHATELARQAGEEGYERVIAMGGDGTVHEVVNGLMALPPERRPCLGVVPLGSGNDFAHAVGVPNNSEAALRQAMTGQPRPIDVGTVMDGGGRMEYWINAIGIGFDTIVTIHSRRVPLVQGFAVYFAAVIQTILFDYRPFRLKVKSDAGEWEDELLMLVLCNGNREGGGFHVAPASRADDGRLAFVGVRRISRPKMLATLPYFIKGSHAHLSQVRMGEFTDLDLISDQPLFIHTDGEIFAGFGSKTQHLSIRVLPGALNVAGG